MEMLKERTATGRVAGGPLYWTPTVEGLFQYGDTVDNPEKLYNDCWYRGLQLDIIAVKGDVLRYIDLLQGVDLVMKGETLYKQDGKVIESAL